MIQFDELLDITLDSLINVMQPFLKEKLSCQKI